MLFLDYMRSYEAHYRELIVEGNESAVITVYDNRTPRRSGAGSPQGRDEPRRAGNLPARRPHAYRSHQGTLRLRHRREDDPMEALDKAQKALDDAAVPE